MNSSLKPNKTDRQCFHASYSDGHCAEMICWNYFSRCPKHSYSGSHRDEKCSREDNK